MPALNWDTFAKLPGSIEKNFELLCRGIVRHNFGSYGVLRALANQPGVEFHLKLTQPCVALGGAGRWWGWQCKWYELPASGALGTTRRKQIEDGIQKTETHVAGVTDWVLWTRHPLTKSDQKWFTALSCKMTLHLWTSNEIDNFLVGQASILRDTYFGELVVTPEILRERHEQSVASIRARWQPDVHQVVDAERELRRMLGESGSWDVLRTLAADLRSRIHSVEGAPALPTVFVPVATAVAEAARESAVALERVADGIRDGDLDLLRDELARRPRALSPDVAAAPRRLRSGNHLASLHVTNAVGGCGEALRLLEGVEDAFASRLVAVLAPAGSGKTQLAAQLTVGGDGRPHGVLLYGRDLHANQSLDDLARRVSIAARPIPSMEALLGAVDAAGQRARRRLPLVIDGLNESEDPRAWKMILGALESTLGNYPYVLLVCTLRPGFETEALPQGTQRLEIADYGGDATEAIRRHFRHYKIDATDAPLPLGLLRHPLTLRLFCEVTNPTRAKVVGIDAMPGSLTALFDRYLDQVGDRIAELAPLTQRYYAQDVRKAIGVAASALWDKRKRAVDVDELRRALGDDQRPWDQSMVRALEHDGVLLRMPSEANGNGAYAPAYDLLGGHVIANELLAKHGQVGFESWIREASTTLLLTGDHDQRHPLADDIVYSLVGQIPRRFHSKQLWQLVEQPLRSRALRFAAGLEAAYLDAATVEALLELAGQGDAEILEKLWGVRGAEKHPLNAEALDRVLRPMGVAGRDLRWTEWIRRQDEKVLRDLERLEQRWRRGETRPSDRLRARWVMWTLTSTVRRQRDQATRTLYWFGRKDPQGLFDLTIDSLSVNDAYVTERMLAASYGAVMSHQRTDADFETHLRPFLGQLASALVGPSATAPTAHYLARVYVRGLVTFAKRFFDLSVPEAQRSDWSFAAPAPVAPIAKGDPRADEVERTLHMDFENYTVGGLFDDRRNYDMAHVGHQAALAYISGIVWSLGWRAATFGALDRGIAEEGFRAESIGNRPRAERYGKKYGWIGFFTHAGILEAQGALPHHGRRLSDVDIDVSFPEEPLSDGEPSVPSTWLQPRVETHEGWLRRGATAVPRHILIRDKIGEHQGPWVAVHGFVKADDNVLGREVWAFLSALIAPKESLPGVAGALNSGKRPWIVRDIPSDHYTFAGEIPWHPSFAAEAFSWSDHPYQERVGNAEVEVVAHQYAWESYHSEMNRAGSARMPSRCFSARFDLTSVPQGFDQCLPDGTRATITLSGIDGLKGDVLYVREDLLRQYVGDRAILWFAFSERELRPYPPSPPRWLVDIQRAGANAWHTLLTEADLRAGSSKQPAKKKASKRPPVTPNRTKKSPAKKAHKQAAPKTAQRVRKKS
jgi:hypothetical protein